MTILYAEKPKWKRSLIIVCAVLFGVLLSNLQAQTAVMRANRVWCGVVENGGTGSFNYGGSWFPADYNAMGPSMEEGNGMSGSRITTAATNWTDGDGITYPKSATRTADGYVVTVTSPLTNYIRWGYPNSVVDYEDVTLDNWGEVNPGALVGTSDQTAEATYVNAMGVEIKRKIFAWSQPHHDNYIVVDVVLTNNSGNTLENFIVEISEGPIYLRKAKGHNPSVPDDDEVGVDRSACWHHYYGARPGDSLRIHYMYHADDPTVPGDQMGGPVATHDGRLIESDIMFYGILHASAAPYTDPVNDVDDPLQPKVTDVYAPSPMGTEALWANKSGRDLIYDLMAGQNAVFQPMDGQYPGTFHRANNDEQNDPDWSNLGTGFNKSSVWNRSLSDFGPYTFGDGQSLHFVYVSGYTGIGIEKEKEVGEKWKAGTLEEPPNLPSAVSGYFPDQFAFPVEATEMDKVKDRWISTGIDTVHQAVSRAKWNFEQNWQIPGSPAPPEMNLTGTGQGVEITWSAPEAENHPNFDGYRIMRRIGERDTVFFEVAYESGPEDTGSEHAFVDSLVLFGATYFYYVQSSIRVPAGDLNAHPDTRGQKIYSGRLWTPTHADVTPKRRSQNDLSKIRIVPNPYNIKEDKLEPYGRIPGQRIQFYNLPPEVNIKIFTESGDLVRTIEHKPLTGDGYDDWDLQNDHTQAVSSGIYIAVFENPNTGEISFQKFIIVR